MAPSDDPDEAAERLAEALERIARLARPVAKVAAGGENAEVAARLDGLIAQLRDALSD